MKTLLLSIFLGALVLVCSGQQMQQTSNQGNDLLGRTVYQNLLTVEGFGYAAINNNRTSFTITFFGYGPNATTAREVLLNQISDLQGNLSGYSLLNRQQGGITYYPYSNSTFAAGAASRINGFVASTTLSFSISSSDAAFVLDILLNNSTAYISINARPDQLLISEAEALAVQNAMDDAIFKAQSALNRLGICTLNITLLTIDSPISSSGNYPQINLLSNNFDLNLNSISSQFTASLNGNGNNNNNNGYNNGLTQVSARVMLNLFHTPCSTSGAITDLTAAIRAEQLLPGSQLGTELGSPLGLFNEASASPLEESGSSAFFFEASASASEQGEVITASPIEVSGSSAILLTDESGNSAILSESGSTVVRRRRVQSFW